MSNRILCEIIKILGDTSSLSGEEIEARGHRILDYLKDIKEDTGKIVEEGAGNADFTPEDKAKLDSIETNAQVNTIEIVQINGVPVAINTKTVNLDLSGYALKSDVTGAMKIKGSVNTYAELPSDPELGDAYAILTADSEHDISPDEIVCYTSTGWVDMGGAVDLSLYLTKTDASDTYALKTHTHTVSQVTDIEVWLAGKSLETTSHASSTYLSKADAGTTYLSKTDAGNTYLSKTDASDTYLSKTDASDTYLSKSNADTTYLNKTDAGNTYLNKTEASDTYLSKTEAGDTYLTQDDADTTYLSKTDADTTYQTKSDTTTNYLKKTDAGNTYLSKTDASNTYQTKTDTTTNYLKKTDASSTYLSKTDASTTYAPKSHTHTVSQVTDIEEWLTGKSLETASHASNTYLSKIDAGNTYLSRTEAGNTYQTKTDTTTNYLKKTDASNTYLSKSDAGTTYLTKSTASSTYLTKTDASNTYQAKGTYVKGLSVTTSNYTTTASGKVTRTVSGYASGCVLLVYLNGLKMIPTTEYTISSSGSFTTVNSINSGQTFEFVVIKTTT